MKPQKHSAQASPANHWPARRTPAAPPVYRPQELPRVLQTKKAGITAPHTGKSATLQLRTAALARPDLRVPNARPNARDAHNRQLSEQHNQRLAQQQLIRVVRPPIAGFGKPDNEAVLLKRAPGVVQPKGFGPPSQMLRHGSVLQLAEATTAEEKPVVKQGLEDDVNWYWVENLTIKVSNQSTTVEVAPHPVHSKPVNGFNQLFYGGYTIVYFHGGGAYSKIQGPWHPSTAEHTEPQFFAWLKSAIDEEKILKEEHTDVVCVIIEINQTYTPCSKSSCRKEILSWVSGKKWGDAYCVARMSAYDLYSHQYPKVQFTSFDAKKIRQAKSVVTLSGPAAVHRIPENYNTY
jgi:hypothetical protein